MARTFTQVRDEILAEKTATPELAILNSSSVTAIWRLIVNVVARALMLHEQLWDVASRILQTKAETLHVGTDLWYVNMAKKFEQGNTTLAVDTSTYQVKYATSIPSLQIVKYAAIGGQGRLSVLKVAKDNAGVPDALDAGELTQFRAYLDRIQFAGAQIVAQSLDADELKIEGTVYYDGAQYTAGTIQPATEAAINTYLQNLPFNGNFYRNKLVDAVQGVAGVIDIDVDILQGKPSAGTYTNIDRLYAPLSGYIKVGTLNLAYVAE